MDIQSRTDDLTSKAKGEGGLGECERGLIDGFQTALNLRDGTGRARFIVDTAPPKEHKPGNWPL
jgi:hypothetical protein